MAQDAHHSVIKTTKTDRNVAAFQSKRASSARSRSGSAIAAQADSASAFGCRQSFN
jgi:hypothetical protein